MDRIVSIARHTFIQQFRNRLYLVVMLFGALIAASSLLFGAVAADAELTVILDLGLAATELFGLAVAVFGAVTLVLEEMESRTVYLILTRPLPRWMYVLGRYFGLLAAVSASMGLMALMHVAVLLLKGWTPDALFFACYPFMLLKIALVTSLALFFSLFSSSHVSSIIFTLFFWLLGHFGTELEFLARKATNAAAGLGLKFFMFFVPRLDLLNFRDLLEMPDVAAGALLLRGAAYALLYAGACLTLSLTLFSRKEF